MNRTTSPSKRRREDELFDLNLVLCETLHSMPSADRPAYLEGLIDRARAGEAKIAEVLSNLTLLRATRRSNKRSIQWMLRDYPATIAQEAHRFTTETWGVHIRDAVRDRT